MEIKIDHREQDPEQSLSSFEQPKPGVYPGVVESATVRFIEKGSSKKPRDIELVVKLTGDKYAGARLFDYPSFSKAATWKMDQLLLSVGLLTRKKRTFRFTSEKELQKKLKGKPLSVRVRGDSYEGEYRAKIAQYMMPLDDEDEEEEFDGDEFEEEEESEEEDIEEDDDVEEEEWTLEDVNELNIAGLRELADELEIDHEGIKKTPLRKMIIEELELDEDEAPF